MSTFVCNICRRKTPNEEGADDDLPAACNNCANLIHLIAEKMAIEILKLQRPENPMPIPMLLSCPECKARHIDVGEFATKVHHTHACQACGHVWRSAIVPTVGVQFLPGFKDKEPHRQCESLMCGTEAGPGAPIRICGSCRRGDTFNPRVPA